MNNKTFVPSTENLQRKVKFFDAKEFVLGRLAVEIAKALTGKNSPEFSPSVDMGDSVVVTNAAEVKFTGRKLAGTTIYHHTGYPKGLRSESLKKLFERKPTEVIVKAVKNMLPNNKLRKFRLARLHVYPDSNHPHQANEAK